MAAVVLTETPGGDPFAGVAVGRALAAALSEVEPERLSGQHAAAWMRAAFRQRNHEDAVLLRAVQEACRARADTVERVLDDEFAPMIAAAGLGWSETMASTRYMLADLVFDRVPALGAAMWSGHLEERKAAIFQSAMAGLGDDQCVRVVDLVLPEAGGLGYAALRERILEAARAIDPEWAAARLAAAVAATRVSARTAPSGAVDLTGHDLPPDLAQDAKLHLDALAAELQPRLALAGMTIGVGALRARLFLRLLDGTLAGADDHTVLDAVFTEFCGGPPPNDGPAGDDPGEGPPPDDGPDGLDGPDDPDGPDGPDLDGPDLDGPDLDGPDGPDLDGPDLDGPSGASPTGPDGRDGPAGPAEPTDLDRPTPDDGPPASSPTDSDPDRPKHVSNGADRTEPGSTSPDAEPGPDLDDLTGSAPPPRAAAPLAHRRGVAVRMRLSTLLGLDDHPGALPELGGTIAETARHVAAAHGAATWHVLVHDQHDALCHLLVLRGPPGATRNERHRRRIVEITAPAALLDALHQDADRTDSDSTDPWLADVLAAYRRSLASDPDRHPATTTRDRDRRLPGAALARWIDARDDVCIAPGCRALAARCDHDHTLDWLLGGLTQADGLGNLCRHDHRAKHEGGWQYDQPEPGRFTITDPTGTVHHTRSRVTRPLPEPCPPEHPFPLDLLDRGEFPDRPDYTARPTRDGHYTPESLATAARLAARRAERVPVRQADSSDEEEPPF